MDDLSSESSGNTASSVHSAWSNVDQVIIIPKPTILQTPTILKKRPPPISSTGAFWVSRGS